LSYSQLIERIDKLVAENEQLKAENARLSRRGLPTKSPMDAPTPVGVGQGPDFPKETTTIIDSLPKSEGWAHLKASVQGFGKESLQDAHAVQIQGDTAVLIVCDGAGSKKHSKAGADFTAKFLADRFKEHFAAGSTFKAEQWSKFSHELLLDAADKLHAHAREAGLPLQEFGATCIIVFANDEFAACSHVGDGRAGYLDPKGVWRSLMVPYKGTEANATIFLSMLNDENADTFIRHQVVCGRTRSIVALSDGPENVCWHVATKSEAGGDKLIDPNLPSALFFGKIANQLAGATKRNLPQVELDGFWATFLSSGNEQLEKEVDDKTLLIALRG
jgi:hypothetical protein